MAGLAAFFRSCALLECAVLLMMPCLCQDAWAQPAGGKPVFDIPAQPLARALAQFDASTGLSVVFPSELVAGRRSTGVHGAYTAEEGLHRLLQSTGLQATAVAPGAFVLVAHASGRAPTQAGPALPRRGQAGQMQSRMRKALCAQPDLALGTYRLAMLVQFDEAGLASQVRLLDTTGNEERDAAIVRTVRQLDLGQAPADADKPFVFLIQPQPGGTLSTCRSLN